MYRRGKQLLAIMLVLALCLTTASMAFAQMGGGNGPMGPGGPGHMGPGNGGGNHGGGNHGKMVVVKGTVVDIDAEGLTITVNVTHANHGQRDLVGQDVIFSIDPDAIVIVAGVGPGTLDDILADDVVKVMGRLVNNENVAFRIVVH